MPLSSSLNSVSQRADVSPNIGELKSLAARGLVSMFDGEKQQFCHRLVRTERGLVREGLSPRYTIMTLLGLRAFEECGATTQFDTQAIYESFARDIGWIQGAGDLGLMVWLTAEFAPDQLGRFFQQANLETALDRYLDARQARTTELAWLLAGLAHAAMESEKTASQVRDLAVAAFQRLKQNQGKHGFFGHLAENKSLSGILRGRIGSFADQIYPIYALSKYATAFHAEEALGPALHCASAICAKQGALGQWWWLYDSHTDRISSRYPVYAVHQHGMAPMGLFALEQATGQSFKEHVYRGLRWVYGSNELGVDMRDLGQNVIWRCIRPRNKWTKYWSTAGSLVRPPKNNGSVGPLEVLFEERPYESGWLLYAFAPIDGSEI
ncbi:MAG TPA: hypothetical protein VGP66_10195 [Candidatus Acidoferrum sp.]|jgi:hypothetical protein|nr:hypothetical protein [Candidatus Acidoferrum sp.]